MWIWEQDDFGEFKYSLNILEVELAMIYQSLDTLDKQVQYMDKANLNKAELENILNEAITTSKIEGEILDRESVKSSIARHLKIEYTHKKSTPQIDGLVEILINSNNYQDLSHDMLYNWHHKLFPAHTYNHISQINKGQYRTDHMEVVSGSITNPIIHFIAPKYDTVSELMEQFIIWFKNQEMDMVIKALLAHLYFLTIHPFDDGNGRIARAITNLALARLNPNSKKYYQLSSQIEKTRVEYYHILEQTQRGNLSITEYLKWFMSTLNKSIIHSVNTINKIINKTQFWQRNYLLELNQRQKKVLNLLLDYGDDFDGYMNNRKYASITKTNRVTAYRDLADLVAKNCLSMSRHGRSTRYNLIIV